MEEVTDGFAGSWDVAQATLPNGGHAYTGLIHVKRIRHTFALDWDITAGQYVGIGLPLDNHVFVSCGEQRAGLGVALFRVQPDERVWIQWSSPELQGNLGSGELLSKFSGSFEGVHEAAFHLPDGSLYGQWTLRIENLDSLFEISWLKGEVVHFRGLGLACGKDLAIGWYPDIRQFAFLDYVLDAAQRDEVNAAWALGGFHSLGTETLNRLTWRGASAFSHPTP